jgi:hypothetical protein
LNRDQRFRKPPLYPFELWGRNAAGKIRRFRCFGNFLPSSNNLSAVRI